MNDYQLLQKLDRALHMLRRSGIYKRIGTTLSDADIMVLFCVGFCDKGDTIKLSDIAKILRVTLPAVTHKVNDLVTKGYIIKEPSKKDLRVTHIRLTTQGRDFVEMTHQTYYMPLQKLVRHLGEQDTRTFIRLLDKISQMGKVS